MLTSTSTSNRLKNIEQTERAKRRLQEQREKAYAAAKANGELGGYNDASYAGLRCELTVKDTVSRLFCPIN